jgi:DHA1 family tetracycline resistance protein-like MFS transporter
MRARSPLLPIFLIVLVDVLGLTIVIPLLPIYAERFGASPLVATLLSSCYAACSLLSSPVIGRLSDHHGRRPLLLISQAGTLAGFLILAGAGSLLVVFVGRILDGLTAGNLSLAQAYISDHTKPADRAKAFGIIGIAFGAGFMFGPAVSGQLARFGLHVPFLAAAALSATSIICTYTLLPREKPPGRDAHQSAGAPGAAGGPGAAGEVAPAVAGAPAVASAVAVAAAGPAGPAGAATMSADAAGAAAEGPPPPAGRRVGVLDWQVYAEYFRRPRLPSLLAQFFLFQFAFSCFTQNFTLFAERRFTHGGHPWGPTEVGWLFAYTGFLGVIIQGGLIGRLVKRFGEARLVVAGFLATAVAYVGLGLTFSLNPLIAVATVAAFGNGVLRPSLTSRITRAVGRHEQGVVLGISQSLAAIAMTLAPPTGGVLIDQAPRGQGWMIAWACVCAAVSAIAFAVSLRGRLAPEPAI